MKSEIMGTILMIAAITVAAATIGTYYYITLQRHKTLPMWKIETKNNDFCKDKRKKIKSIESDAIIVEIMAQKKKKRVYNPYTKKYYELRQRTSKTGKKGQIKGLWKKPKDKSKKSIWDL
jgi:flagellar hook assembly protein FlgD